MPCRKSRIAADFRAPPVADARGSPTQIFLPNPSWAGRVRVVVGWGKQDSPASGGIEASLQLYQRAPSQKSDSARPFDPGESEQPAKSARKTEHYSVYAGLSTTNRGSGKKQGLVF